MMRMPPEGGIGQGLSGSSIHFEKFKTLTLVRGMSIREGFPLEPLIRYDWASRGPNLDVNIFFIRARACSLTCISESVFTVNLNSLSFRTKGRSF